MGEASDKGESMTTTCLFVFLLAALSIALHDRRIYWNSFAWWAVNMIAVGMFLTGRML